MTTSEDIEIRHGLKDVYFGETGITEIDGSSGVLKHRGVPIEELVDHPFERVVFLLLEGEWPSDDEFEKFSESLAANRRLPDDLVDFISTQKNAPADVVLQTTLSLLSGDSSHPDTSVVSLAPSIVATHGAVRQDRSVLPPDMSLGLPADCLRRVLGRQLTELERQIINKDFILHADHGANASTFVARVATSADADPLRSVVAAIATFCGPKHGGAIASIAAMLDSFDQADAAAFVKTQQRKGGSVMGFGHRVYKVEDPRARLFRQAASELADERGDRSMLEKVDALVEAMRPYQSAGIGPNVDLYAAVVYRLLGLDMDQMTAMFASARMVGWMAQIREQRAGSNMLIRPRLLYVPPAAQERPGKDRWAREDGPPRKRSRT